jgi:hypothetical protein
MAGDAVGQLQEAFEPVVLGLAEAIDLSPVSAPARLAQRVMARMSSSRCFLVRLMRGSVKSAK